MADWMPHFEDLILLTSVVSAHPDIFVLSTDTLLDGLGAIISQTQEGGSVA